MLSFKKSIFLNVLYILYDRYENKNPKKMYTIFEISKKKSFKTGWTNKGCVLRDFLKLRLSEFKNFQKQNKQNHETHVGFSFLKNCIQKSWCLQN